MGSARWQHRLTYALLATALSVLAAACGGSEGGNPTDCPVPTSATGTAAVPASCEEDPGGVGY